MQAACTREFICIFIKDNWLNACIVTGLLVYYSIINNNPKTMKTLIDKLSKKYKIKGSIWNKKGNRFYINDCRMTSIYKTKKTRQSVYIDLDTFIVHCYTDCPSQGYQWCANENERVESALRPLARLIRMAS